MSQTHPRTDFHLQFRSHFWVLLLTNDLGHPLLSGSFILLEERRPAVLEPLRKTFSCWHGGASRAQMDGSVNGIDINLTECWLTCEVASSSYCKNNVMLALACTSVPQSRRCALEVEMQECIVIQDRMRLDTGVRSD